MRLPGSLDDLRGLRAARWVRESTAGQFDRYGPGSQHEQMDRFTERYGLVETGRVWTVAHSGRTVWRSPAMAEMLAAARSAGFDVLLTGYFDRWQRNLRRTLELVEDTLHPSGVAWVMCDRRLLSSDPNDWDEMIREAHEAERYSRKLAERIADGYAAKFERLTDPAGQAPLGFRRVGAERTLSIDPGTIGRVVAVFERYATGVLSYIEVGDELGVEPGAVRELLRNPIYNGFVRRRRRSSTEDRRPAAWRADPPVSDELWNRVQTIKARRTHLAGKRSAVRERPLLAGLLHCVCGRRLWSNGASGSGPIVRHPWGACVRWGDRLTYPSGWYEDAISAQITAADVSDASLARIVGVLGSAVPPRPEAPVHRRRRELALSHAAGNLTDAAYLAGVAELRRETSPESARRIDATETLGRLRELPALWEKATPALRRELVSTIYDRIVVRGRQFVDVRLTPAAQASGMPLILPRRVESVSREGVGLTGSIVIPIEGRRDWLQLVRTA